MISPRCAGVRAPIREKASMRFFSMKQKRYDSRFGATFSPPPSGPVAISAGASYRCAWTFLKYSPSGIRFAAASSTLPSSVNSSASQKLLLPVPFGP